MPAAICGQNGLDLMTKTRQERLVIANQLIDVIASHGRRFFHHNGRVSRFELDHRGRVWFVDKYTNSRIYTHYRYHWRDFTEGGTLRNLVIELRDYIMGRRMDLPLELLGPWPDSYCGGDLWGYGDAMIEVRKKAVELKMITKDEVIEVVKKNVLDNLEDINKDDITAEKSMKNLGANSLDIVEVVSCSMRDLKITVPRSDLIEMKNIGELVDLLHRVATEKSLLSRADLLAKNR